MGSESAEGRNLSSFPSLCLAVSVCLEGQRAIPNPALSSSEMKLSSDCPPRKLTARHLPLGFLGKQLRMDRLKNRLFKVAPSCLFFDDVYIADQHGKDQVLGKSGCDHCLQIFYFFFLCLGARRIEGHKLHPASLPPQYPGKGRASCYQPRSPNTARTLGPSFILMNSRGQDPHFWVTGTEAARHSAFTPHS